MWVLPILPSVGQTQRVFCTPKKRATIKFHLKSPEIIYPKKNIAQSQFESREMIIVWWMLNSPFVNVVTSLISIKSIHMLSRARDLCDPPIDRDHTYILFNIIHTSFTIRTHHHVRVY